jgi:hypothetical protein
VIVRGETSLEQGVIAIQRFLAEDIAYKSDPKLGVALILVRARARERTLSSRW